MSTPEITIDGANVGARPLLDRYEMVVGLEVHVQLATFTKAFCRCSAEFGAPPNTHVCPVCLGLPGALPVLNDRVVDLALRAALALDCEVHPISIFARKNYFYPDLPKGYQISQYDRPLATAGRLTVEVPLRLVAHRGDTLVYRATGTPRTGGGSALLQSEAVLAGSGAVAEVVRRLAGSLGPTTDLRVVARFARRPGNDYRPFPAHSMRRVRIARIPSS